MLQYINNTILRQASLIPYRVSQWAPGTINEVIGQGSELCVWSGGSDATVFGDPSVNYAFRALHDHLHRVTGLGFTPAEEVFLGQLQASRYEGILADLVYIEVAGQAEYFLKTGSFVQDQKQFTLNALNAIGWTL